MPVARSRSSSQRNRHGHAGKAAKKAGYADLGEAMGDKVNKLNRGTDAAR
jgi:hypothetical protein